MPADDTLSRRHYLALGLVAVLILVDQLLVQPPFWRLATDAPVINLAGRQRMLSQKLAKTALEVDRARRLPSLGVARLVDDLRSVADVWSRSHEALRLGDPGLEIPAPASPTLQLAWRRIDPAFREIHRASIRLADRGDQPARGGPTEDDDLARILAREADYLDQMERIVGLLEVEARGRVVSLRRFGWALAGLAWVGLAGIGWFVLRPASRMIRRQFGLVRDAQHGAEVEVEHRTEALRRANADLRIEAEQRRVAQAEHRTLVEQFSHASRTNTVGEMATSLAHEINQPLAAVANYLEGSLVALGAPDPPLAEIRDALTKALSATHRAGQILHRIRRFVRRHPALVEEFDPNQVVAEVEAMLRDEVKLRGLDLQVDLAPGLPRLSGDPVQIQQVLVNLVRNAVDALQANRPPEPRVALSTRQAERGQVEFVVADNGEGIPTEQVPRVFDPFFSTRAEGMGMGLAISRTIVEAHQGRLTVESQPGLGASFQFSLPTAGERDDDPSDGLRRG